MSILEKQKMLENEEDEKYHCRLCDKRFNSGRALGGHMRVHGMFNIEPVLHPNEGTSTTGAEGESFDGNRLPTSHICQNYREEFCSLKSLSKHYCYSLVGAGRDHGENDNSNGLFPPSLPRSRTTTPPLVLTKEEHVANCYVLLSTASANPVVCNTDAAECSTSIFCITNVGECSTSERKEVDYVVLSPPSPQPKSPEPHFSTQTPPIASFVDTSSQLPLPEKKPKVHECSICKRRFPSGQALGGHKRCHWRASSSCGATIKPLSVVATELQSWNSGGGLNQIQLQMLMSRSLSYTLDLNMPAPTDDIPEVTLCLDMHLQPERENTSENVLNVNIEEAESREVRLNDLSHLIDINESKAGSTWLQIGFESMSKQDTRANQP